MTVDVVFEERYWYPDDGGVVWLAGYQLVEAETGRYLGRDAPGARRPGPARSRASPAPGAITPTRWRPRTSARAGRSSLRRDPDNEHDPSAIAVDPAGGGEQVGWVPREVAADLAPALDAGEPWAAVVLRERRASPRDPRTGLTMLLAPAAAIELRAAPRRPPP